MGSYSRKDRLADHLKKIIDPILRNNFNPLGIGLMTITNVKMSSDFRLATIYISFINNEKSIEFLIGELNKKNSFYKFQVSKKWNSKFMPDIEFQYDDTLKNAEKMTILMRELSEK